MEQVFPRGNPMTTEKRFEALLILVLAEPYNMVHRVQMLEKNMRCQRYGTLMPPQQYLCGQIIQIDIDDCRNR